MKMHKMSSVKNWRKKIKVAKNEAESAKLSAQNLGGKCRYLKQEIKKLNDC